MMDGCERVYTLSVGMDELSRIGKRERDWELKNTFL
jgi:hypothetical protein